MNSDTRNKESTGGTENQQHEEQSNKKEQTNSELRNGYKQERHKKKTKIEQVGAEKERKKS